jgi:hypothetical protein
MAQRAGISDRFAEIEKRVDNDEMLTAEQREEIKERAYAHVRKKQIEKLTDQIFNEQVRLAETDLAMPDERIEEITIELPEFAYMISIDNVAYYHGCTYDVPRRKYLSMIDQMARTWEHDREIHGQRRKGDVARDPFHRGVNIVNTTRNSLRQSSG